LKENSELKEGRHICRVTLQMPGDTQSRKYSVLSYRGVIRVAMRSEGKNAVAFRDWAEDVLYEVMVHGAYSREDYSYADELNRRAKAINSELRALKADNSFRKQAETEARNIMQGKKSLDDLAGYPKLQEAVEKILESSIPAEKLADTPELVEVAVMEFLEREGADGRAPLG